MPGFLVTKRFRLFFGQGDDAVTEVEYDLAEDTLRFAFELQTSDPAVRGRLEVPGVRTDHVAEVRENGNPRVLEAGPDGSLVLRDVLPNGAYEIKLK